MFEIDSSLDISHHLFWGLTADEVEPKQASFDESPATPMEWNSNTPVSSLNDDNEDTDSPMETADIPDAMHISFLKSLYQSADFDIESMDLDDDNIVSEAIPGDIDSPIIILDSDSEEDEFDVQITRKSRLPIVRQDTVSFTQPRAKRRCQYKCTLDTPPQSKVRKLNESKKQIYEMSFLLLMVDLILCKCNLT
ncbi:hypothetical protein A0J61_06653 [Choanephora cucurbitarum]|uniref:Uncharacterized protein n=1 Tax=Choanephora cucurbitarum TaxID=101091 RepID=A0A1C7N9H9_9FUNG|nr:hypothetical protein A0J61_06653 [Choanephora cucurbitarum]